MVKYFIYLYFLILIIILIIFYKINTYVTVADPELGQRGH